MAETACNKGPQSSQQGKTPQEVAAGRETKAPLKELTVDLGGGVKLEMILIPAWEFMMGSPDSDKNVLVHEKPQHRVRITKPFYLGEYLVTQEQWQAVMGNSPSRFKGPKNPVEQVSWDDCQAFLSMNVDTTRIPRWTTPRGLQGARTACFAAATGPTLPGP
jgi:formylglycine-generating enzyme required for sulfatase activity